jgi:uncharacterized protein
LQGPPGTGKTSGALAPAILARAYAGANALPHVTLVTAPSNKALDEVLAATADRLEELQSIAPGSAAEDILLARLVGSGAGDVEPVAYVDTNGGEGSFVGDVPTDGAKSPYPAVRGRMHDTSATSTGPVVLFATPYRTQKFVDGLTGDRTAGEWLGHSGPFDALVVDEASMLDLRELALTAGFVRKDGQLLVAGDHRQLPSVQHVEWDGWQRRAVHTTGAHVSLLDYCRYLRGELPSALDEERVRPSPEVDVPMHRLGKSFRLPADLAALLSDHVYAADDVSLSAVENRSPRSPRADGSAGEALTDGALSLVTHDGNGDAQSSAVEAAVVATLAAATAPDDEVGIVAPYNGQRAAVERALTEVDATATVDTVERMQGDGYDVVLVTPAASDPSRIADQEEFLFEPRRLNVALSRARRLVVPIVSRSLLAHLPERDDDRPGATLLHALHDEVVTGGPAWTGPLAAFVDGDVTLPTRDVELTVYSG